MLSLWANWLVTKFGLNSLRRYLWPVLYVGVQSRRVSFVCMSVCICIMFVYLYLKAITITSENNLKPSLIPSL